MQWARKQKELVMQERKRFTAAVMVGVAILLTMPVRAAPFDEKAQAPRIANSQALRSKLAAHFATFERKQQEADPAAFIRDRVAHKQWSDLFFAVELAMAEKIPLKGLDAFGLVAKPGGRFVVDLQAFPQWEPLDSRLRKLTNEAVVESYVPALRARGFRDEDVDALRAYLANNDPEIAVYAEGRPLVETFAQRLQGQRKDGKKLNLQEVLAYRYQKSMIRAEAQRRWAVGLMDALDAQRQRVLVSFLDEGFKSEMMFGVATEPLERTLEQEAQPVISGESAEIMSSEEARLRQRLERRAEKLMEGEAR
jgi:hypothetical protein